MQGFIFNKKKSFINQIKYIDNTKLESDRRKKNKPPTTQHI